MYLSSSASGEKLRKTEQGQRPSVPGGGGGHHHDDTEGGGPHDTEVLRAARDFRSGEPLFCLDRRLEQEFAARFTGYWAGDFDVSNHTIRAARRAFFEKRLKKDAVFGGEEAGRCLEAVWLAAERQGAASPPLPPHAELAEGAVETHLAENGGGSSTTSEHDQQKSAIWSEYLTSAPSRADLVGYHPGTVLWEGENTSPWSPHPSLLSAGGALQQAAKQAREFQKCVVLDALWQQAGLPTNLSLLEHSYLLQQLGRGHGAAMVSMLTDLLRPGGDNINTAVLPARWAPSASPDSELETQLAAVRQTPVVMPPPRGRANSSQDVEQEERDPPPTLTCLFATKDIPKDTEIVVSFENAGLSAKEELAYLGWHLKHGKIVMEEWVGATSSAGGEREPMGEGGASERGAVEAGGPGAAAEGDGTVDADADGDPTWEHELKDVCAGLERDAADEHNVWQHSATNRVAAILAKWAEIYCTSSGVVGTVPADPSGDPPDTIESGLLLQEDPQQEAPVAHLPVGPPVLADLPAVLMGSQ